MLRRCEHLIAVAVADGEADVVVAAAAADGGRAEEKDAVAAAAARRTRDQRMNSSGLSANTTLKSTRLVSIGQGRSRFKEKMSLHELREFAKSSPVNPRFDSVTFIHRVLTARRVPCVRAHGFIAPPSGGHRQWLGRR
jgi:hypothetical protein